MVGLFSKRSKKAAADQQQQEQRQQQFDIDSARVDGHTVNVVTADDDLEAMDPSARRKRNLGSTAT